MNERRSFLAMAVLAVVSPLAFFRRRRCKGGRCGVAGVDYPVNPYCTPGRNISVEEWVRKSAEFNDVAVVIGVENDTDPGSAHMSEYKVTLVAKPGHIFTVISENGDLLPDATFIVGRGHTRQAAFSEVFHQFSRTDHRFVS